MIKRSTIKIIITLVIFLTCIQVTQAQEEDSPFYPDLQFSGKVFLAGSAVSDEGTVVLRSVSAIKKEEGKCAVTMDYEIYNKGAIAVNQRFFSGIEINGTSDSSRLINGIGAGEKKTVNAVIWLVPEEPTDVRILLDNFGNVKEVSEDNNSKELKILLKGSCEQEPGEDPVSEEEKEGKGLFKRYQFKK